MLHRKKKSTMSKTTSTLISNLTFINPCTLLSGTKLVRTRLERFTIPDGQHVHEGEQHEIGPGEAIAGQELTTSALKPEIKVQLRLLQSKN